MSNISTITDFVNHTKVSNTAPELKSNISNFNNPNVTPVNGTKSAAQQSAPALNNASQTPNSAQTALAASGSSSEAKNALPKETPAKDAPQIKAQPASDTVELNKKLNKATRKNGLIEKGYDKIKNLTGLGVGSKKIKQAIEQGKDSKEIEQQISDYRVSQEKIAQTGGDILSIMAAGGVFFGLKNRLVNMNALRNLKNSDGLLAMALNAAGKKGGKINGLGKMNIGLGIAAAMVGGLVKYTVMKINRIGSDRYNVDKNDELTKEELRKERQYLKAEKRSASFRNFGTGALNGLLMPVMSLGGIIGTPIYLAANMASRYFIGEKNDEESKTPATFVKSIVKNPITSIAAAALIAIPLFRKGQFTSKLVKNTNKVVSDLNNSKLMQLGSGKTTYQELEEILFSDSKIKSLIETPHYRYKGGLDDKIRDLTNENIFAIKFEQIKGSQGGGFADLFGLGISFEERELIRALKESCPASRSFEDAKKLVAKTFGKQYKLKKCLGVGTVAETYLAKDTTTGQEVCIKMLKKGISKKKINDDKEAFRAIIKAHFAKHPDKKDEMEYLIKNMENIADGIAREVDFANEMEAAKKLAQHTTKAKVVQPIRVKDGLYVMEKADGISLDSFIKLNDLYTQLRTAKKLGKLGGDVADIERQIAEIKAKTPAFDKINFDKEDAEYLLKQYMDILVEQFSKTEKGGKTIHGDIHPGNIFIDPKALRSRQGTVFTLIDTGNTIDQTAEQAIRAMNLTKYIDNADVENLAKYALDGAKLPKGLSKEKALQKMEKELRRVFFDNKTAIGHMNNDAFTSIANNIMKKLKIIPSDTQGSLNKARQSADTSFRSLRDTMVNKIFGRLISGEGGLVDDGLSWAKLTASYSMNKANQEKANLKQLTPKDRVGIRRSKSTPKKNSIEYLTYKLKQQVKAFTEKDESKGGLFGI